ncbi:uncharacterized protein LOC132631162 [Lycium barbarum]|uniref:uncharacterized protein LOC132631162 n=1 Tax=Lycium barbarum TaxID=112863 RepID=UPI00293F3DCD|nr:uncharacterized protein LOC132631162 [Lycium barbarum]
MAKEAVNKGKNKNKQVAKATMEELQVTSASTSNEVEEEGTTLSPLVTQKVAGVNRGTQQAVQQWNDAMQTSVNSEIKSPNDSGKKSWADVVEEEVVSPVKRSSIWDNFDITNVTNAGYKLEYIAPDMEGESPMTEINSNDISSEIEYWKSAVVCYVLGAHPPFEVIQGFIHRLWAKHGLNKIAMLKNGVILSPKGLSKICSLVGRPLMVDRNTEKKIGLNFARVLVEVGMDAQLPETVFFRSERGNIVEQPVTYDWKPTLCKFCKKYGHSENSCRRKKEHTKKPEVNQEKQLVVEAQQNKDIPIASVQVGGQPKGGERQPKPMALTQQVQKHAPAQRGNNQKTTTSGVAARNNTVASNNTVTLWITPHKKSTTQKRQQPVEERSTTPVTTTNGADTNKSGNVGNEEGQLTPLLDHETKVKTNKVDQLVSKLFGGWDYITNLEAHYNGRILIIWRPDYYTVVPITINAQVVTCEVRYIPSQVTFEVSFVYALNTREERRLLWENLEAHSQNNTRPWLALGDFNSVLKSEDRLGGNPVTWAEVTEFQNCVDNCGFIEMVQQGQKYTWNDKGDNQRIYSKIDWSFINNEWLVTMPACRAWYMSEGISDHCSIRIAYEEEGFNSKKSFQFCNDWTQHPLFKDKVKAGWEVHIAGCRMFQVVKKLKLLKRELKDLNKQFFRNVVDDANDDREALYLAQNMLQLDPLNYSKMKRRGTRSSNNPHTWLNYFRNKEATTQLKDEHGNWQYEPDSIANLFVQYYQTMLGSKGNERSKASSGFLKNGPILSGQQQIAMLQPFVEEDVKQAIFTIDSNKSPGPNGFGSGFYKAAWSIVGSDITEEVLDYFMCHDPTP